MVDHERRLLASAERLLVDGNNLVGGPDNARLGGLEAALRRIVSPRVQIDVFRDGGARSADDQIIDALGRPDPGRADRLVVVTDDRELRDRARRVGAGVVSARLFRTLLAGAPSTLARHTPSQRPPQLGSQRPPLSGFATGRGTDGVDRAGAFDKKDEEPPERRWQPGRGATRKRGPSARRPRGR